MIPFGSGAGGRIGSISIGNTSTIEEYEKMVNADIKPTKRIMRSPLRQQHGFVYQLENSFEKLRILAPDQWPENLRLQASKLTSQWQDAGLLTHQQNKQGIRLSCAGTFWATRMNKMLNEFIQTSA